MAPSARCTHASQISYRSGVALCPVASKADALLTMSRV